MKKSFVRNLKNWRWWVVIIPTLFIICVVFAVKGVEVVSTTILDKVLLPIVKYINNWTFQK